MVTREGKTLPLGRIQVQCGFDSRSGHNLLIKTKNMAKIIENEKGFRLIEIGSEEMREIHPEMKGADWFPICDSCARGGLEKGVYVAVLNRWLCPECCEKWYSAGVRYPGDTRVEERNFNRYKEMLAL